MLKMIAFAVTVTFAAGTALLADEVSCEAAIVYRSGSEAYDEAVRGIRSSMEHFPCRIEYVDLSDPASGSAVEALAASQKLVVGVGVSACGQFRDAAPWMRLLPALILRKDLGDCGPRRSGAVFADMNIVIVLERLHELFPQKLRVGLIHGASSPALDPAALAHIQQMGYALRVVPCAGPDRLLAAFSSLKGNADFVLTEPDAELYNTATIKPLVLASIDQRLPIVGFSAGFVRAGALLGVYPDFRDLGFETGEVMQHLLSQRPAVECGVRNVVVAFNPRIARLIGFDMVHLAGVEEIK